MSKAQFLTTTLTAADREQIFARYGRGVVVFTLCDICGKPTWSSTDGGKPDEIEFCFASEQYGGEMCGDCQDVLRRSPEIFNWTLRLAKFAAQMAVEKYRNEVKP